MLDVPPEARPVRDPPPPATDRTMRLLRRLSSWTTAGIVAIALFDFLGLHLAGISVLPRFHALARTAAQTGATGVALATLLLMLTGARASLAMLRARVPSAATPPSWPRWLMDLLDLQDTRLVRPARSPGASAKHVQGSLVPALAGLAAVSAWAMRPTVGAPTPEDATIVAAALLVLAFFALVAERGVAAPRPAALPEARALRELVLIAPVSLAASACAVLGIAVGLDGAVWINTAIGAVIGLVALELALRALGRWFLPAPAPAAARAAVDSLLAAMLAGSLSRNGMSAPIRSTFGIDFSRSWALSYLRAAALPALLLTALLCWGLTGLTAINIDERGIYERLGAPVAVLRPGLRLVLPWPLGRVRRVEFGVVHEVLVGNTATLAATADTMTAEAAPTAAADRLWDQTHPGEATFLIASETAGRQGFQTINADIRVLTRVGLSDQDAFQAAYATNDPATLVREVATRRFSQYFAARTLDEVLGERRETMAATLRAAIATDLAPAASGMEIMAVVIEAVHPPAGAATAYHQVQAAKIEATATISGEQARARATRNQALQEATHVVNGARGDAAEAVRGARADLIRFNADRDAAAAGGKAFLLERYLGNLSIALAKAPLTIVDHRIAGADAPVIDLRPIAGAATAASEDPD
jgi:regulator of protease activity HflC (stomatin/prohibitin superfamily)